MQSAIKAKTPQPPLQSPIRHIAVVIPAHNEQDSIAECVRTIVRASDYLTAYRKDHNLAAIKLCVIVVLDSCTDDTQTIVQHSAQALEHVIVNSDENTPNLQSLTCAYRCVGQVRDFGVHHAIVQGADWIACTDADSQVTEEWLVAQLNHVTDEHCDMICGVVSVDSWAHLTATTKQNYLAHYQDRMHHRHIHGANLSFSAQAYDSVGGFAKIACHEDVDLVKKFDTRGLSIVWSNQVRVITSSRLEARADEGFAHFLNKLQQDEN